MEENEVYATLHNKNKKNKTTILVDNWIYELTQAGYSYDQMLEVFKLAGEKLKKYRNTKK